MPVFAVLLILQRWIFPPVTITAPQSKPCHHLTGGSDGGRIAFLEWCSRDGAFAGQTEEAGSRWDSLDRSKGDATTGRTLLHLLRERGLIEPGFHFRAEADADLAKLLDADNGNDDDWSMLRELIVDVLCSGVEAQAEYTLNWIANMFQRPWKVAGSSIVFRGAEGTGKGTLGRALMHISGAHGLTVASSSQVTGRFNAHLRNCIFLFSDEVNWHGSKTAEGALKALITEPIIQYEQKGKDPGNAPNIIHVLMASNEDWVIPAGETARRYFVADVDPKRKGDQAFFDGIDAQLNSGGYEAFLHDMLARDLTGWNPGDIPGIRSCS